MMNEDISAFLVRELEQIEIMGDMVKSFMAQGRYYGTGAALSYLIESIGLDLVGKSARNDTTSAFGMSGENESMIEISIPLKPYGETPEDLIG